MGFQAEPGNQKKQLMYDDDHYDDYMQDAYMEELYQEHKKEAIEEFTSERLQSYYLNHKLLAQEAFNVLTEARKLTGLHTPASFIFAAIAMEVGLKTTLLKPIVFGLVHTESVAALITDLTLSQNYMKKYRKLLSHILKDQGGIDLDDFKRLGSNKTLWEEFIIILEIRNAVMHRAQSATQENAALALSVASEILENVFPAVITKMGFHLHDGFKICDNWKCKYPDL